MSECQLCTDPGHYRGELGIVPLVLCDVCNAGMVDYVFGCYGSEDEDVIPSEVLDGAALWDLVERDYPVLAERIREKYDEGIGNTDDRADAGPAGG